MKFTSPSIWSTRSSESTLSLWPLLLTQPLFQFLPHRQRAWEKQGRGRQGYTRGQRVFSLPRSWWMGVGQARKANRQGNKQSQ